MIPLMLGNLAACFICAFFGISSVAMIFMVLFVFALIARLWANFSIKDLSVKMSGRTDGVYPGEELKIKLKIRNNKLLPVMWLRIYTPLQYNRCMEPAEIRPAEKGEVVALAEMKADTEMVGEKKLPSLLWYEKRSEDFIWRAKRRGIYYFKNWRLITGDGFGLVQKERPFEEAMNKTAAVYPAKVKVSADIFLRSFWNSDTGRRGILEDVTLVRSTRTYQPSDSAKLINWRQLARGQGLASNVYERILPRNIHFIFDGESFSGETKDHEAMEEALSILGSLFIKLEESNVSCGLSLPASYNFKACDLFHAETRDLLFALAGYDPKEDIFTEEKHEIISQVPKFNIENILGAVGQTGRFYYVCYDTGRLHDSKLLKYLDNSNTSIISYVNQGRYADFETLPMERLCPELGSKRVDEGGAA